MTPAGCTSSPSSNTCDPNHTHASRGSVTLRLRFYHKMINNRHNWTGVSFWHWCPREEDTMVRKAVMGIGILILAKAALAVIPLEGTRLAGTGEMEFWGGGGVSLDSGYSVAVAADGTTALVGGLGDGAARVLTLAGGVWSRQSDIPAPNDRVGAGRGCVVAVSADGNTALVGCPWDNAEVGAVWVYARSGGMWSQQGPKLIGTGAAVSAHQGYSVALSADGSTAIVGGPGDGTDNGAQMGAAWVFTRFGGVLDATGRETGRQRCCRKLGGAGILGCAIGGWKHGHGRWSLGRLGLG